MIAFKESVKLLISLTAILLLSGCAGLAPFPTNMVWETDLKAGVCGQYKVVNPEKLQFAHVRDWPLSKCDGTFGFSAEDVPKVFDWARTAIQKCKQGCK